MPTMKVMIACEFSGIVRDAFTEYGHDAVSCDLIASERPKGNHIIGDIMDADLSEYDLLIAHPPCTYLAISGARWFDAPGRREFKNKPLSLLFHYTMRRLIKSLLKILLVCYQLIGGNPINISSLGNLGME